MAVGARREVDVAIVGGGPGGSTLATLLKKYEPSLRVLVLEKEKFPREHVGESHLPPIGAVLHEMGVWDKVEAANFPIKIGATYRWGNTNDLWDFEFLPPAKFKDQARPATYEGQRRLTAFQVDRMVYDDILLRHAESLGVEVREETLVRNIEHEGDRITGLVLADGSRVEASHYVDAAGNTGLFHRAMGVGAMVPETLKNIAIWGYWDNAEWAVEIGVGATRVQVLSIGCGWVWFIPLGPTRTSVGFVCPAEHFRKCGKTPEALYHWALQEEPRVRDLMRNATMQGEVYATKDWSYCADRLCGENWFLVGDSCGFADPILAGGMTLAHTGARIVAYSLLSILRGEHDPDWLKAHYDTTQRKRISQYIRFAEFWYSFNGCFTDLREYTQKIAADAGLKLDPRQAFRWLSFGGFGHEDFLSPGLATFDLLSVKEVTKFFLGEGDAGWELNKFNLFRLNLEKARKIEVPIFSEGRTIKAEAWHRDGATLPFVGYFREVVEVLRQHSVLQDIYREFEARARKGARPG
ncbi:MAG: tryptophan 7-halogenase [Phycisphaerales bacterium]|nr:tryptophan 7-halogenase [Phycisphaerales bacterium]